METQQPSFYVVRTWRDVELIANGETPHSSSDARRKPLPPQIPDTPRPLPAHAHTAHSQHTAADGVHTHRDGRRRTRPPNAAGSRCSRSPWHWRCSPPACVAPSSDAFSSEHPSSLETGNTKRAIILLICPCWTPYICLNQSGGSSSREVWLSPRLLAPATISSYSILCLRVSSTDLAGRFLRDRQEVSHTLLTAFPVASRSVWYSRRSVLQDQSRGGQRLKLQLPPPCCHQGNRGAQGDTRVLQLLLVFLLWTLKSRHIHKNTFRHSV